MPRISYSQIVNDNIHLFNHGATFTRSQLNQLCGTPDAQPYTDVRGARHYLNLNKHLRPLGLYIKASNYYSDFEILPIEQTEAQVISYMVQSRAKQLHGDELRSGRRQYANWNTMSATQRRAAQHTNWRT